MLLLVRCCWCAAAGALLLVRWDAGALGRWCAGTLVRWDAGRCCAGASVLVCWCVDALVCWCVGVLVRRCWRAGALVWMLMLWLRWRAGTLAEKGGNKKETSGLRYLTKRLLHRRSCKAKATQDHRIPPSASFCFFALVSALALARAFLCFRTVWEICLRLRLGLALLDAGAETCDGASVGAVGAGSGAVGGRAVGASGVEVKGVGATCAA